MNQPQVIELQQVVGNITDSLGLVFDCMEVAEGEIDAAKRRARNEDERNAIHGSFRYMLPTEALRGKHMDLYRAHACELIERVRIGGGSGRILTEIYAFTCRQPSLGRQTV